MRSLLFVPGSDERKLRKAFDVGADAVIADWEDSVLEERHEEAQTFTAQVLRSASSRTCARLIRIRAPEDAEIAAALDIDAIVLPKATPQSVAVAVTAGVPLIALIETAQGLENVLALAAAPGVVALMLGSLDLSLELGLVPRTDGLELLYARSSCVLASARHLGVPPIDGVNTDVTNVERLERDCALARSLGFGAKACIHPAQVEVVNRGFSPTTEELTWAHTVIDAAAAEAHRGRGAILVDGALVDRPVIEKARRLLSQRRTPPQPRDR
jgi:citrate lyase subunit beta/citryl-CoA lyase